MTLQNEEAEELMRKVEKAEEQKGNVNGPCLHLCIVNLVIGLEQFYIMSALAINQ